MISSKRFIFASSVALLCVAVSHLLAQGPPGFGPPGFGGPGGGPRDGGPMGGGDRELVEQYDADGDGWLNTQERAEARKAATAEGERGGRGGGPPGRGRRGRQNQQPPQPGVEVSPAEVTNFTDEPLYDPATLRTLFLEFENSDWEAELEAFNNTDVEVPATLTVDGKTYRDVGVHFRGQSSYFMVPSGMKRSLNLSLDFLHDDQRLNSYKTLNLLNCNGDSSFMSTVLYSHIARQYLPAPKANFVKVVINGENWGIYTNVQQFNKDFIKENYDPSSGTRWKVGGSPRGDGGLRYTGTDVEEYKSRYDMKSNDDEAAWDKLIELCRTLNETPLDELEAALEPMLDIDGALKFLALDVALVNSDGYWTRASDYYIFLDSNDKFHVIPHDMNEAFRSGGGRGGPGGPRPPGAPAGLGGFGPPGEPGPPPQRQNRGRRPELEQPEQPQREPENRRANDPPPRGGARGDFGPGNFGPGNFGRGGPGEGRRRGRGVPGGGGGPGGPGHGGVDLDPLVNVDNPRMPLRSRLLKVPHLREKYLQYIRAIAEESLSWENLGPVVEQYRDVIDKEVEIDTKKLDTYEAFTTATSPTVDEDDSEQGSSLRAFADKRREFLLKSLENPAE